MPFLQGLPRLVCALAGLAFVGCYSPYRYAPSSPYGAGVPMYSPQGAPAPQFGPPVGSPTPVYPNGGIPSGGFPSGGVPSGGFPPANGSQLTPTPDPNSSFPPSNSGGFNSSSPSNGDGLVPNYGDPDTLPPPTGGNTFEGNTTPFMQDGASFQRNSDASQSIGSTQGERIPADSQIQLAAHRSSPAESLSVGMNHGQGSATSPNPYGYDVEGYRWLQGIVDFDEQQKVWVLIYDLTPDPQDVYKGQITLVDNPLLRRLQNNDVVFVEGRLDDTARDRGTGKPQYRVEKLHGPLVPQS